MGQGKILGRLSTLVRSNVNDLIDSMQDPGKELDQMVLDMEDSAREARGEVVQVLAEETRIEKQIGVLEEEARTWETRAATAVQAGDDALAREALRRKAEQDADRLELQKLLGEQKQHGEQLVAGLKALDARIKDVQLRQGTLREKARAAKGRSSLSSSSGAFGDFDRMSGKIDAIESEVGLIDELQGHTEAERTAERKLTAMTEDRKMDDALAELKKKLGG